MGSDSTRADSIPADAVIWTEVGVAITGRCHYDSDRGRGAKPFACPTSACPDDLVSVATAAHLVASVECDARRLAAHVVVDHVA